MTTNDAEQMTILFSSNLQILFLFTTCLTVSFSFSQAPPTLGDLFEFVLFGDIAFKIAAVGTNVVVQGSDGDDADGNGIASEWAIFQRKLIAAIDRFGSTLWASTVFHNDLLGILVLKLNRQDVLE